MLISVGSGRDALDSALGFFWIYNAKGRGPTDFSSHPNLVFNNLQTDDDVPIKLIGSGRLVSVGRNCSFRRSDPTIDDDCNGIQNSDCSKQEEKRSSMLQSSGWIPSSSRSDIIYRLTDRCIC